MRDPGNTPIRPGIHYRKRCQSLLNVQHHQRALVVDCCHIELIISSQKSQLRDPQLRQKGIPPERLQPGPLLGCGKAMTHQSVSPDQADGDPGRDIRPRRPANSDLQPQFLPGFKFRGLPPRRVPEGDVSDPQEALSGHRTQRFGRPRLTHGIGIGIADFRCWARHPHMSAVEPKHLCTKFFHLKEIVRTEHKTAPGGAKRLDPPQTFGLKALIADRQRLVNNQKIRIRSRRQRKGQAQKHPGGIDPHRLVHEVAQFGKVIHGGFDLRTMIRRKTLCL